MAKDLLLYETKIRVSEESSASDPNTTKIHYTWKIHNFSLCSTEIGHALKSPAFPGVEKDEYSWQLILYPNGAAEKNKGSLSLKLIFLPGKRHEVKAKCMINLLRDTKTEHYQAGYKELRKFNKGNPLFSYPNFIGRSDVIKNTYGLLPNDVLTIVCDIMIVPDPADENNSVDQSKASACHRLHNDLSDLFESPKFCDVTLIVITCGQEIQAHKAILAARSPVFAAMFNHDFKEQKENQVDIIDVDYDVLKEMLRYVYTGKIPNLDKMADGLLMAADKYELETLKDLCENVLCKSIAVENAANLLLLGDLYSGVRLKREVLDFICTHTKDVLKTTGYQSLRETHPHLIYETVEALAN